MPKVRYVNQGEFYVTTDPDTMLVTDGMTECFALAFVDQENPNIRLLCHLDGQLLFEYALENITALQRDFVKSNGGGAFDVYIFGGQERGRTYPKLKDALEKIGILDAKYKDGRVYCEELKRGMKRAMYVNATNQRLTMVCSSKGVDCGSFSKMKPLFGLSETELENGEGLRESPDEYEEYLKFSEANDKILDDGSGKAVHFVRSIAGKELIEEYYPKDSGGSRPRT